MAAATDTVISTQADLAQALGVSRETVSRALNHHPSISPALRERIEAAAAVHLYRPNAAARAVKRGRFSNVLLLHGDRATDRFFRPQLLAGIYESLAQHHLRLSLAQLSDADLASVDLLPRILREWSADGLLIDYVAHVPRPMRQLLDEHRIPAVWINTKLKNNAVYLDDLNAARDATRHLLTLGHRRIAYVDFNHRAGDADAHYSAHDRRQGYLDAMRDAGLDGHLLCADYIPSAQRARAARDWFASPDRPTAVVTYSGEAALLYGAAQGGLRAPDDLSIITFSGENATSSGMLATAMVAPERDVGRRAVELLQQRLASPRSGKAIALSYTLIAGETTGPLHHRRSS